MATGRIILPIETAVLPSTRPATKATVTSSGSATSNTPKVTYQKLTYSSTADQAAMWNFRLPSDYSTGGTVSLRWTGAAVTGNIVWKAGLAVGTSSGDFDTSVYLAADNAAAVAVPTTAGVLKQTSIGLTHTGAVAGAMVSLFVGRDADNGSDTSTGGLVLVSAAFTYDTT